MFRRSESNRNTRAISDYSQYFIGGMMPDSGNPVQQALTIIQIRPYRNGCQRAERQEESIMR
jgi:hypothetical protein